MLTDTKLKNLKPADKAYKVTDREGLYVSVQPGGTISFRYDYRFNGRRETLTIGKYGSNGISLAEAREELNAAKKLISAGESPAAAKKYGKLQASGVERLEEFIEKYMQNVRLADSTRAMRKSVIDRDIIPNLGKKLMTEVSTRMVRDLCNKIVERGGRSTAVQVRDIISYVYRYANDQGYEYKCPAKNIRANSIAKFTPRKSAMKPTELGIFFRTLKKVQTMESIKIALRFIAITLVRKSELVAADWAEFDREKKLWSIPAERMKARRPHLVPMSDQAEVLLATLKLYSEGKGLLISGRYDSSKTISNSTLNRVMNITIDTARKEGESIGDYSVHDLRRTASTLLHEAGYPSDWIEKCLAHEQVGVRAVYNKAEYLPQRTYMLQQWADMVDGWIDGSLDDLVPFSPLKFEKWMNQRSA